MLSRPRSPRWLIPLILLMVAGGAIAVFVVMTGPPKGRSTACRFDANAAWASVDWTSTEVPLADIDRLATDMAGHHVRYLYPFTTYKKPDGFSQAYVHAKRFNDQFRQTNTSTRLIAWVGVPLKRKDGLGIDGSVDLSDRKERREILDFVRDELIDKAGFDGVQFNVETTFDQNAALLTFLDEARDHLGPDVLIAVAGETWAVDHQSVQPGDRSWSADTYREVGLRVDQIAAMLYDSRSLTAGAYQDFLRSQVAGISHSLANTDAELLIGMSVSREASVGHLLAVETVESAMIGTCAAVDALESDDQPISGMAMYASWEATPADWQMWDLWVR